jgi:hypothetical protein
MENFGSRPDWGRIGPRGLPRPVVHPDEPGLWARRDTVYLQHQRPDEAESMH